LKKEKERFIPSINFAKNVNQQFKYPIFHMRESECTHDHRHEWFEPLFSGLDFNEQWEELGRRLGKN
jgi:hypothetical protein